MKYPYGLNQVLHWNREVVPVEKQPRPIFGIVVGDWHDGLILEINGEDVYYRYSEIEKLTVIL